MLGLVFNIHNPLNYDVGFPELGEKTPLAGAQSHKVSLYHVYDKEKKTIGPAQQIKLYKVRLCGLIKTTNNRSLNTTHSTKSEPVFEGFIKHKLIQWNNRTGGVFYVKIKSLDHYGRIEADLIDPVSGESLSDWLLKKYPEKYQPYTKR